MGATARRFVCLGADYVHHIHEYWRVPAVWFADHGSNGHYTMDARYHQWGCLYDWGFRNIIYIPCWAEWIFDRWYMCCADPVGYADLHGESNRQTECTQITLSVYGLVEGFLEGHVEVMLLPERFVMVCYELSQSRHSRRWSTSWPRTTLRYKPEFENTHDVKAQATENA